MLVQAVSASLDFGLTHPFYNGWFLPIVRWVAEERELLEKIKKGVTKLDVVDMDRIWGIITKDFTDYRKGLRSAYLKVVIQTYKYANITLPSKDS
jgi:hypothetical protein